MMRSLNTAATGMVAQQNNLNTIANNLANVNTTGFKGQRASFEDLVYQTIQAAGASTGGNQVSPMALQVGLGVRFSGSATNYKDGNLLQSGDLTNMAIVGDGFFQIEMPDGTMGYTRDGNFTLDANGLLVTQNGYPMSPQITVQSGTKAISISQEGVVSGVLPGNNEATELGRIKLYLFSNPQGLTHVGQNLYKQTGGSGDPQETDPATQGAGYIQQGYLEGSNVEIVQEMVNMIMAQRAYEINSKAIQTSDDMLGVLNSLKR